MCYNRPAGHGFANFDCKNATFYILLTPSERRVGGSEGIVEYDCSKATINSFAVQPQAWKLFSGWLGIGISACVITEINANLIGVQCTRARGIGNVIKWLKSEINWSGGLSRNHHFPCSDKTRSGRHFSRVFSPFSDQIPFQSHSLNEALHDSQ